MSQIDFSRLRSLTTGQIVSALERDGFQRERRPGATTGIIIGTGEGLACLTIGLAEPFP